MTRQEMLQQFEDRPMRRGKPRVEFGRTEAWRDRNGTHRRVVIRYCGEEVGMISGEPFMATSSPEYTIEIEGGSLPRSYDKLVDAKAAARRHFGL